MGKVELNNTQLLLRDIVTQEYLADGTYKKESDYFEYFAVSQVLKDYDLSIDELKQGIIGSGGDGGCDAIYIFLNGSLVQVDQGAKFPILKDANIELVIVQAKNVTSFNEDAFMKWKTVSEALLPISTKFDQYSKRYNNELLESYKLFQTVCKKYARSKIRLYVKFFYVTLADELHPNVKQQASELETTIKKHYPISETCINFIDAIELYTLYQRRPNLSLNLALAEIPIALGYKKDYVTLVNLRIFYQFIKDDNGLIRRRLFEANVRDYQGKNNVNKSIQETLSLLSVEDFWWLNNGITILSSNVVPINSRELQLDNPVIVNGLQTSHEVFSFYSQNPISLENESRNILVRIIVPESEESRNKIIFATNNQTNIPKSTLRVTDAIHLEIELYFKNKGLYYDRRKNYYKNEGKKPSEIVGVSFLGQCMISIFLKKPDYARARPSTFLNDDNHYNYLYKRNNDLEVFYKCAVIGKRVSHYLNQESDYSSSEKSDVLFYIVYVAVAQSINKKDIEFSDMKNLSLDLINESSILKASHYVREKYKKAGGNGRIARSSEFTDDIIAGLFK